MEFPIEQFNESVGEIMMYCQCIEENAKRIYSYMQSGNPERNRLDIEDQRLTLGQVITFMKDLDQSRGKPFFSPRDYQFLFLVSKTRNEYAHNVYTHFCYLTDPDEFEASYAMCVDRLKKDKAWLYTLYAAVEDARMLYEDKKYGKER